MKKIALILIGIVTIFMIGCSKSNIGEGENPDVLQSTEESIEDGNEDDKGKAEEEELYVKIKAKGSKKFLNGGIEFQPKLQGNSTKELQYRWTIEESADQGEELIDGLVGEEGPVYEIVNDGEDVGFGVYAGVTYVTDDYSERKINLQVLDKESGAILAEDSVRIENHGGYYIVESIRDEKLAERILKTSKSRLYGKIVDTIWDVDSALNSGVSYINVDTRTFENFDEEDKKQLFEYLEEQYDAEVLDMTMDELEDAGYIKDMSFIDGIAFSIDKYIVNSENKVSFEGRKWASGIGAVGFITEGEYKNGQWEIIRCDMTWIS